MQKKQGTIVLLNGTSSAGKSTILQEFHRLEPAYKILKIDDWFPAILHARATELGWRSSSGQDPWLFLYDYLYRKTGKHYFATQAREALFNDSPKFFQVAQEIALQGHNVIIDTVLEYEKEYTIFFEFFKHNTHVAVLVYCPLDVLLKRVQERNASGVADEERTAFQSFEQFPAIFKIQEHDFELPLDVVQTQVIEKSLERAMADLIDNNIPKAYLPKLKLFKKKFIQQFKLHECKEIILVPRHRYDFVCNSGKNSPQELARALQLFLSNANLT